MTPPDKPPPPPVKKVLLLPLDGGGAARSPSVSPPGPAQSGLKVAAPDDPSFIPKGVVRAVEQTFEATETEEQARVPIVLDASARPKTGTMAEAGPEKKMVPWSLVWFGVLVAAVPVTVILVRQSSPKGLSIPQTFAPQSSASSSAAASTTAEAVVLREMEVSVKIPKRVTTAEVDGVETTIANGRVTLSGKVGTTRQLRLNFPQGHYDFPIKITISGPVPNNIEF